MVSPMMAAKLYASAQGAPTDPAAGVDKAAGSAFSNMVQNAINDTIQSSKAAEAQMTAQTQGKAELIDVVTAVAAAEASLETVMAVRDQVIAAYQEIMRMPI